MSAATLFNHPPRRELSQKVWPLHIDGDQPVKAFFTCFQNVRAHLGCNTSVIHQQVEMPKGFLGELEQLFPVAGRGNVSATNLSANRMTPSDAERHALRSGSSRCRLITGKIDHEVVT